MNKFIKVLMLVNTAYCGQRYIAKSEATVPEDVAHRWANRGIAKLIEEAPEKGAPEMEDFSKMSAKQLYEMCINKGFDVAPRLSKSDYITLLTKGG